MLKISVVTAVIALLVALALIVGAFLLGRRLRHSEIRAHRRDATTRSRSVILGEVYEKVAPFLPDFPYAARDMVFLGKGVDYVVFDGLSEGKLERIVFLELKSGQSRLSKNELMIREAIRGKRVDYEELRLPGF
ncbi:MAG: Holliday junction resolvase-like protein [Candidatus Methylumidiphilus sp.]